MATIASNLCHARADPWVTAYYGGYSKNILSPSNIDYTAVTHIVDFAVIPKADGTFDTDFNLVSNTATDLVARAHSAGRKVLLGVGGAGTAAAFEGATSSANRSAFIGHIISHLVATNYDGVDIDWEPLTENDFNQFTNFVISLRSALSSLPNKLITVAAFPYYTNYHNPMPEYKMFASIQDKIDQINIMTYLLSGADQGWVTWFDAPILAGTNTINGQFLAPSIDGAVNNFLSNNVAAAKLGVGIYFSGMVWSNSVTHPLEQLAAGTKSVPDSYHDIIKNYYQPSYYRWDTNVHVSFLSISNLNPANQEFVSYNDARACQEKVYYAHYRSLGGVMLFELRDGYLTNASSIPHDPLLQAVKQAATRPRPQFTSIQVSGQNVVLRFGTIPFCPYRVLWTSDPKAGTWNTLTNNLIGDGSDVQVIDSAAFRSQSSRFYRIEAPP